MLGNRRWGEAGRWLGLIAVGVALAACATATPPVATISPLPPTATPSAVPATVTATARPATATPQSSETPALTQTVAPLPTPTALPTKQTLIQFWNSIGGDGGDPYGAYLGSTVADLVIYTDGQVIVPGVGGWRTATLSADQMCGLLKQIEATGFFAVPDNGSDHSTDPIYTFDDEVQFSDGAPDYLIQVNGPSPKQISVYYPYRKYVLPAIEAVLDLLAAYPVQGTMPYISSNVVVWVEPGRGVEWEWRHPAREIDPWPADLPALAELVHGENYQPRYFQGAAALKFSELPKPFGVYSDKGLQYLVIVRPLLPHETFRNYQTYTSQPTEFDLPFDCN